MKTWTYEVDKTKHVLKNNEFITEDGEVVKLHNTTLENIAMELVNYKEEEEQKKRDIKEYYIKKEGFEKDIVDELGHFYFSFYNKLPKIEKQFLFRFVFMCTYLKYNDTRIMIKGDNNKYTLIKEYDLQELLKLSKTEYYRTKNSLIENNLIYIDTESNIHINNKISTQGNINNNRIEFTRIFKSSIQELYNKSLAREHKRLALFIDLLPFVNFNLNIICYNPSEVNPELIKPLTIKDIQKALGSNADKNIARLKQTLLNTFVHNEKVMIIVKDFEKEFFVVNPKLYYKGNRKEDLNYLINLFSV